jgi:hypothetical protein
VNVVEFGSRLVQTGDLDPIYTMLNATSMPDTTLNRWCLAYWMFYHAGVASQLAESPNFWDMVWRAQREKWPRGTERRHYKAAQSERSIKYLQERYPNAEDAADDVSSIHTPLHHRFEMIQQRAMSWVGFGPWIAFKIADMVDAVLHVPGDFTGTEGDFFDDPVAGAICVLAPEFGIELEGAELVREAKAEAKAVNRTEKAERVRAAVKLLKAGPLGKLRSPTADRPLGVQEYETIFCKYKSHLNGHYPVGKDTKEIIHGLHGWGDLAQQLATNLEKTASDNQTPLGRTQMPKRAVP